ncbi:d-isomer specific 2-hydroxyacid dehydrogenase- like protein [Trypanosoma cruzi]|uniref:D-isomer specific 2-hydroxyacid dehydrogenase-like protein n=1 Tax=Trypanosoma cruzi TaxID=5693 RepID=A0A2V2UKM1_TRYCR|nr:d-isomer specific 2-hydroxyacid dehydrogenase- like protein [Trypanosoma cruzi]
MKEVSLHVDFKHVVRCHGNPQEDFMDVKQSGEPIVLLIANKAGREALKFLCDDYHLPKEQRRVRWIHSISSGLDSYKLNELVKELQDIPLTNARGCYSSILAEHVMYSMLYFYRQTWRSLASRAEHKWDPSSWLNCVGGRWASLATATLGRPAPNFSVPLDGGDGCEAVRAHEGGGRVWRASCARRCGAGACVA